MGVADLTSKECVWIGRGGCSCTMAIPLANVYFLERTSYIRNYRNKYYSTETLLTLTLVKVNIISICKFAVYSHTSVK